MGSLDASAVHKTVSEAWDGPVLASLSELVAIPAVSQGFDPDWASNGHLDRVIEHVRTWALDRGLPETTVEVVRLANASPVLLIDVAATGEGSSSGTVLLYGHLDKQPPVGGWAAGLGPWTPVVRDGRLYGRGAADDGYAPYAALTAIEAVRAGGGAHARCVVLLETGEESGSPDLPSYLEHLRPRLGEVSLVVCLDSGTNDYERLWLTTSLRGLTQVHVTATVLEGGQHSGIASGVVPSSFRILRELLDRLEDSATGEILLPEMNVTVPPAQLAEIRAAVEAAPGALRTGLPLTPGVRTVSDDDLELTLNNTWRPTLSITGASGLPDPDSAGNVLRPFTTLCLSFRLPPTADSASALAAVRRILTTDVPYGAQIELAHTEAADGWQAPEPAPWLRAGLDEASDTVFGGAPWRTLGLGGSIPFMGLLQQMYPSAQFIATGVLGLDSNAHVPNESINLDYAAKLTEALAIVLDAHANT
ncbi:MAG TPA: M20/M25/M40 family metallo-hydrolase [Pseudonocardiaceae bacterium]|jgi:acetylornithine deacetylase/succinyl-diaminopimelate desuccinylase-like protein|nr:M20/M25/M40 family metallo-hydrolase [Pseudonocardiaceae bacterium]